MIVSRSEGPGSKPDPGHRLCWPASVALDTNSPSNARQRQRRSWRPDPAGRAGWASRHECRPGRPTPGWTKRSMPAASYRDWFRVQPICSIVRTIESRRGASRRWVPPDHAPCPRVADPPTIRGATWSRSCSGTYCSVTHLIGDLLSGHVALRDIQGPLIWLVPRSETFSARYTG